MDAQLLYQEDPNTLEFEAEIVEKLSLAAGRMGVVLDRTYFYPTGGGQEHDTGKIGSGRVVDVYKDEGHPRLIHVVEGEVGVGRIKALIDVERRLRHMQHHTAQHLLTQCILRQAGFETVSANINGYSPSTLDIVSTQIQKNDLDRSESMANRIIYEDLPVKTYFVTPAELREIPLRRPPKVTENIRIVEIEGFDYSPCGGTHVMRTGSIGLIKVVKAERQNEKIRIHFIAGMQAMETFHQMYEVMNGMANQMSTSWMELPGLFDKQAEQLSSIQKENQALRQSSIKLEARELAEQAEKQGDIRWVRASFLARPLAELRMLAEELNKFAGLVAYLSSYDGQKVSFIVCCGTGTGKDARQLLTSHLSMMGGRGGGTEHLAQGGGNADEAQYRRFLEQLGRWETHSRTD